MIFLFKGYQKHTYSRIYNRSDLNDPLAAYIGRVKLDQEAPQALSDDIFPPLRHEYACSRYGLYDTFQADSLYRRICESHSFVVRSGTYRFHYRSLLGKDACALCIYSLDSNAL